MLFKNPKYAKRGLKTLDPTSLVYRNVGHIWLDNRNKQIKATNHAYVLLNNGDLLIRNLTYAQHFGQFACITRQGNKIDSVSTFIYPVSILS